MARPTLKKSLLASGAAIGLLIATPAFAQIREFNVPAQDARQAIPQFARQAGIQISAPTGRLRGVRTRAIRGNLDAREALRALIEGTGLTVASDTGSMIVLRYGTAAETPQSGEAEAGGAAAGSESANDATPEILVIGSRSQNVDIRRTEDDPQPYLVFDSAEIRQSNATNLEDFFRSRLSVNTRSNTNNQSGASLGSNVSIIDLRGLGANQTLILVDGRRPPYSIRSGGDFGQADINGIPLSAIERVEVLPSTAGAIYGASAVGGVINIIRRRGYQGIELTAGYAGAVRGGGDVYRAEISAGLTPNHGRTQFDISVSHVRSSPLYGADNDLLPRARANYARNTASTIPVQGYTTNIRASTNLVLRNGTPLGSNITSVPVGYTGGDAGAAFVTNAGRYNTDLSDDAFGTYHPLRSGTRVRSLNASVRHEFSDRLQVYLDGNVTRNANVSTTSPIAFIPILASNPINPFAQTVTLSVPLPGVRLPQRSRNNNMSLTGGLLFRAWGDWSVNTEIGWTKSRSSSQFYLAGLNSQFFTDISSGVINPFFDVNRVNIDFSRYLIAEPNSSELASTSSVQAAVRASGTLLRLPGGNVRATGLIQYIEDSRAEGRSVTAVGSPMTRIFVPGRRENGALYGELLVPLFSRANAVPLIRELEIQASARYDEYRVSILSPTSYLTTAVPATFGNAINRFHSGDFLVAARWVPVQGIALRGSFSTGYVPPNIGNLISSINPQTPAVTTTPDPRRGGQIVGFQNSSGGNWMLTSGGNSNLQPERVENLSFGVIFKPSFIPNLRVSVDYSEIEKRNGWYTFSGVADGLANEQFTDGRVIREAVGLPGDPPGWAPPIRAIDISIINLSLLRVVAYDINADYFLSLGTFGRMQAYGTATLLRDSISQFTPTSPVFDRVGFADGPLRWRANFGLNWNLGSLTLGWNTQIFSSYSVRTSSNPLGATSATSVRNQGAERVPGQNYHDVFLTYRFGDRAPYPLRDFSVSIGVQNLFDARPPVYTINSSTAYSFYGDPRLRRFSISLTRSFGGR